MDIDTGRKSKKRCGGGDDDYDDDDGGMRARPQSTAENNVEHSLAQVLEEIFCGTDPFTFQTRSLIRAANEQTERVESLFMNGNSTYVHNLVSDLTHLYVLINTCNSYERPRDLNVEILPNQHSIFAKIHRIAMANAVTICKLSNVEMRQ